MSASRLRQLVRPVRTAMVLMLLLIAAMTVCVARRAAIRTAALRWIRIHGGTCQFRPLWWHPPWIRIPEWAFSVERVVLDHDPCDPAIEVVSLSELHALREVQELSLARCLLGDDQLRELTGLKHLRKLNLGNTAFADLELKPSLLVRYSPMAPKVTVQISAADHALRGLPLEELHLGGRDITGPMLARLDGLPLRRLDLSNTPLGDDDLPHLPDIPLDELDLSGTRVTNAGLDALSRHRIKGLRLGRTRITDKAIPKLAPLSLKLLDLRKTGVSDAMVPELMKMRLQVLSVDETFVTLRGVRTLVTLPSLRRLELGIPQLAGVYSVEEASKVLSTSTLEVTGVQTAFPPFCP